MRYCTAKMADISECLAICSDRMGSGIIGPTKCHELWGQLVASPAFHSAVIEAPGPNGGSRIVGFGCSVLVHPEILRTEEADPRPGMNDRIFERLRGSAEAILNDAEIRACNTREGVGVAILYSNWRRDLLNEAEVLEVQSNLAAAFLELHKGFHIARIAVELMDPVDVGWAEATRVYRVLRSPMETPCLGVLTRESAFTVAGSIASILFHPSTPELALTAAEQDLLRAALGGATDAQLAAKLGISVPAVKKRWISIFSRVSDVRPEIWPVQEPRRRDTRGPQKRHHLLAHLRSRPEELRPAPGTRKRRHSPSGHDR